MEKTTTTCRDCGGRIEIVRDLEDEKGASEIEEHHQPDCPTPRFNRLDIPDEQARP